MSGETVGVTIASCAYVPEQLESHAKIPYHFSSLEYCKLTHVQQAHSDPSEVASHRPKESNTSIVSSPSHGTMKINKLLLFTTDCTILWNDVNSNTCLL